MNEFMKSMKNPLEELKDLIVEQKKNTSNFNEIRKNTKNIIIDSHPIYGKFIKIDDLIIAIDHWNPEADVIYISHAHMDHIPVFNKNIRKGLKQGKFKKWFLSSRITKEIAEERTRKRFTIPNSMWALGENLGNKDKIEVGDVSLQLIENGHTYGSTSLLIEGSEKILYTSDFTTETRKFSNNSVVKGLDPIKCDIIITECTFGSPQFIFPSFAKVQDDLNAYISLQLEKGNPVILLAYAFGKSQYLLNMLDLDLLDTKILLDRSIAKLTKILEKNGVKFNPWEPYGNYNKNQLKKDNNYVLIIPNYFMFQEPYKSLISDGAKIAVFSGKVLLNSFRDKFPSDKYIPYSDHCDYNSLIQFLNNVSSKIIYLEHGSLYEFFYHLKNRINKNKIFLLNY